MTGHLGMIQIHWQKNIFVTWIRNESEYSWLIIFRMMTRRKSRLSAGVLPVNCSTQ